MHRRDDRPRQSGQLLVPATDRRPGQREAIPGIDAREPVQRLVVLPPAHDGVGQHPRARPAPENGQVGRIADQHVDRSLARRVLGDELRPDQPDDDARRPAALEHLAHLFPDAPEVFEPALLDLMRDQLDVDAGEVLGQRLAATRLRPLVAADGPRLLGLLGRPVLGEESFDEGQGELAIVRRDALGLLAEKALLELLVTEEEGGAAGR
jgi:hypothetical protein